MSAPLSKTTISVTIGVFLGGILGAIWSGAQSVKPVRLDHEPVSEAVSVDDPQRIDPLVIEIADPPESGAEVDIPLSAIDELCGDGDGCDLRLMLMGQLPRPRTGTFGIQDSNEWFIDQITSGTGGSLDDLDDETILSRVNAFPPEAETCNFREDTEVALPVVVKRFELVAANTFEDHSSHCALRIED